MTDRVHPEATPPAPQADGEKPAADVKIKKKTPEAGGPAGPEPTRYGDWERGGRCIDF